MARPTLRRLGWLAAILVVANEVRGLAMAAPILYTLWATGGTAMQVWLAVSTLLGVALSVAVPAWVARRLRRRGQ